MRVLVVGSGGREHALCWKIRQSPLCSDLYCAPGNAGTAQIAESAPIPALEIDRLAELASDRRIDLTVVGPDDPLAAGIVDRFRAAGLAIFGPTRDAAQIEWSKRWAKQFCREHDIPTAAFDTFEDPAAAHAYVDSVDHDVVVKADGLALGKGVFVCRGKAQAHEAVDALMRERVLGAAGATVVIEELLVGREVSATVLCDGTTYRMLPFACDHKAAHDGDRGPNTGGMGAFSPPEWFGDDLAREVELRVVAPAVRGLRNAGRPFVGFLYPGLMLTQQGLRVVEFNSRMGDPEAQVLLPRLDVDLLHLLRLAVEGRLSEAPLALPVRDEAACCVVLASGGYPDRYATGREISGLESLDADAIAFYAGTRREDGRVLTAGGRVLGITGVGPTVAKARDHAYRNVERVRFENVYFRRDIGLR